MKLLWITFADFVPTSTGEVTSTTASARYRVLSPVRALGELGVDSHITTISSEQVDMNQVNQAECDVVVFSKSFFRINERIAKVMKEKNIEVVFDICDNHFEHEQHAPHYQAMCEIADLITCNTDAMQEIIQNYSKKKAVVIPDPYESPKRLPVFDPEPGKIKLLWFGHPSNLDSVKSCLPALEKLSEDMKISCILSTTNTPDLRDMINAYQSSTLSLTFRPWLVETQWEAFAEVDLVIIPSIANDKKNVKSPNRMIDSLRLGKMVVASPLPSYMPFADWAWIGDDIADGIRWALDHPSDIPPRIKQAQDYIEQHHSLEHIGQHWYDALSDVIRKAA